MARHRKHSRVRDKDLRGRWRPDDTEVQRLRDLIRQHDAGDREDQAQEARLDRELDKRSARGQAP